MGIHATVSDYMSPHPLVLKSTATAAEAKAAFEEHGFRFAPVVDPEGRCVGVVTVSDLLDRADDHALASFMSLKPLTVEATVSLSEAAAILAGSAVHHLLVVDHDRIPVGVLSTVDVSAALADSNLTQPTEWIMSRELLRLDAGTSVVEAREVLADAGLSSGPVMSGERLLGFVNRLSLVGEVEDSARVDEVMTNGRRVRPDTPVRDLARLFGDGAERQAYVLDDDGELVGLVSSTDVVRLAASLYEEYTLSE